MKKMIKIIGGLLLGLILIFGGYLAYLFLSYDRLPDKQTLTIAHNQTNHLQTDTTYKALTFNIGFGAYSQDFSFFMDSGKYSRAYDEAEVKKNMTGITAAVQEADPDIAFFQEVDVEGDRSRHVDQVAWLENNLTDYSSVFAQNYDSAYLFYPFTQPIGKARSGLVSLAKGEITESTRYSLPIETNFNKFFDLDRAFSVSHVAVADNQTLTMINLHLSAFTKDPTIHEAQLTKLFSKMSEEYEQGHYVIVAGDYNHDLIGNSPEVFGTKKERETWTHPFPVEDLPKHFSIPTADLQSAKVPSVRASNIPYDPDKSYVSLVDGFLVSDNIQIEQVQVMDQKFQNSDHNPVTMSFQLKK